MLEKTGGGRLYECPDCGGKLDFLGHEWEGDGVLAWLTQCSKCGKLFEEEFRRVKWKEVVV